MSNLDKNWKNKVHHDIEEILFERQGREVLVSELVIGSELITKWTRNGSVATTTVVRERIPCPGHNGNHVHINKTNCYDSRAIVWVK